MCYLSFTAFFPNIPGPYTAPPTAAPAAPRPNPLSQLRPAAGATETAAAARSSPRQPSPPGLRSQTTTPNMPRGPRGSRGRPETLAAALGVRWRRRRAAGNGTKRSERSSWSESSDYCRSRVREPPPRGAVLEGADGGVGAPHGRAGPRGFQESGGRGGDAEGGGRWVWRRGAAAHSFHPVPGSSGPLLPRCCGPGGAGKGRSWRSGRPEGRAAGLPCASHFAG